MSFREWIKINESVKQSEFDIVIESETYRVIRVLHLLQKRDNDSKPKDFTLSIKKYTELFDRFLKRKNEVNLKKPISVTWETKNGLNNIISFTIKNKEFKIFGCIVNSSKHHSKLYPKYTNRIHVGVL